VHSFEANKAQLPRLLMQRLFARMHCYALIATLESETWKHELHTQIAHELIKEIFCHIQTVIFPHVVGETSILLILVVAGYPKLRRPIEIG